MKIKLITRILAIFLICSFITPTPVQAGVGAFFVKLIVRVAVKVAVKASIAKAHSNITTVYVRSNIQLADEVISQKNPDTSIIGIDARNVDDSASNYVTIDNCFVYAYATDGSAIAYSHVNSGAADGSNIDIFELNYLGAISNGGSTDDNAIGIYTEKDTAFSNTVNGNYIDVYSDLGVAYGTYTTGDFNKGSAKNIYYVYAKANDAYGIYLDNVDTYPYLKQEYVNVYSAGNAYGIYLDNTSPYLENCTVVVSSDSASSDDNVVAGVFIVKSHVDSITGTDEAPSSSDDDVFVTYNIKDSDGDHSFYYDYPYTTDNDFDNFSDASSHITDYNISYEATSSITVSAITGSAIGIALSGYVYDSSDPDGDNYVANASDVSLGSISGVDITVSSVEGNAIAIYTECDDQIGSLENSNISISASGNVYGYMLSTTDKIDEDVNTGITFYNESKGTSENTITDIDYATVTLELISTGVSGGTNSAYGIYVTDYSLDDSIDFSGISVTAAGTPFGLYVDNSEIAEKIDMDFSVYTYSLSGYGVWAKDSSLNSIYGSFLLTMPDDYSQTGELSLTAFYLEDMTTKNLSIYSDIYIDSAATNITLVSTDSNTTVSYYGDVLIDSISTGDTSKIAEGVDLYVYTLGENFGSSLFYNRDTKDSTGITLELNSTITINDYTGSSYGIGLNNSNLDLSSIDISGLDYGFTLYNNSTLNLTHSTISASKSSSVDDSNLSLVSSTISGDLSLTGTSTLTLENSNLKYSTVTVSSDSTVTINSSIDNDLTSLISSSISLEDGGSLVFTSYAGLYIDKDSSIDLDFSIDLTGLDYFAHYVLFSIEDNATYEAVLSYLEANLDTILSYDEGATLYLNPYYGDDLEDNTLTWIIDADAQSGRISLSNLSGDMYYFNWQTDSAGNKSLVEVDSTQAATADVIAYSSDNESVIDFEGGDINHSFIGLNSYNGGAIYNSYSFSIGNITGDFVANYAYKTGGAIYNYGTIDDIIGDFVANYAYIEGGAIYNIGTIDDITGDFIGNYADADDYAYGGAIYNNGTIDDITGDFTANYADGDDSALGGAIYNRSSIGDIEGDFTANYTYSTYSYGGAIYNTGTIDYITGDFTGNYATSTSSTDYTYSYGGAIYNTGTIDYITGDFTGNYATFTSSTYITYSYGGAIYNTSSIGDIEGDFTANYANSTSTSTSTSFSYGGAIYNYDGASIDSITGNFVGNSATVSATVSATALNNYARGGAIYNYDSNIASIEGDFIGNYVSSITSSWSNSDGGAIYNYDSTIGYIEGDFIGNYATSTTTTHTTATAEGGAVYNEASSDDSELSFFALNGDMEFTGNYVESITTSSTTTTSNAIYNYVYSSTYDATINLNALDGNSLVINDGISGGSSHVSNQLIEINDVDLADYDDVSEYGLVSFNNEVEYQTITVYNGVLELGAYDGTSDLYGDGTNVSLDASIASLYYSTLTVNDGAYLYISTNDAGDAVKLTHSTITLNDGATLVFDDCADLSLDSYSKLDASANSTTIEFTSQSSSELTLSSALEYLLEEASTINHKGEGSLTVNTSLHSSTTLNLTNGTLNLGGLVAGTLNITETADFNLIINSINAGSTNVLGSDVSIFDSDGNLSTNTYTIDIILGDIFEILNTETTICDSSYDDIIESYLDTTKYDGVSLDENNVLKIGDTVVISQEDGSSATFSVIDNANVIAVDGDYVVGSGESYSIDTIDNTDGTLTLDGGELSLNAGAWLTLGGDDANIIAVNGTLNATTTGSSINVASDMESVDLSISGSLNIADDTSFSGSSLSLENATTTGSINLVGSGLYLDNDSDISGSAVYLNIDSDGNISTIDFENGSYATSDEISAVLGDTTITLVTDSSMLIGETYKISDSTIDEDYFEFANGEFSYSVGSTNMTLTSSDVFQLMAETPNETSLAIAVDSIDNSGDTTAKKALKVAVETNGLDSYIMNNYSQIAEVNTMLLSNMNFANVNRARAILAKSANASYTSSSEVDITEEATEVESEEVAQIKYSNVAQLQSINLLGSKDGNNGVAGYDYWSVGSTANFDKILSDNALVGASIGGTYNKVEGDAGDNANSATFLVNAYATYANEGLEVFANIGYAHFWNEGYKAGSGSADWDSDAFNALIGISYDIETTIEGLTITPLAMLNMVYLNSDSASYSNGVNVDEQSYFSAKLMFGFEVEYAVNAQLNILARAMYSHEMGDESYDNTYSLGFVNGVNYIGSEAGEDSAVMGLGLSYDFSETCTAYFDYNAYVYSNLITHSLNLSVGIKF